MSGLWTPSGGNEPEPSAGPIGAEPGIPSGADDELMREEIARFQAQLAATPALEVVANHAVGLFELGRLHLALAAEGPEDIHERRRRIEEARLCCDAFAGIVESLGDRLGEGTAPLTEGLGQMRIAIVQVSEAIEQAANPA
jgi:hypothetical protein